MPTVTRLLYNNLVQFDSGQLSVLIIDESNLIEEQDQLRTVLERNEGRALGLAAAYSPTGQLTMLAVADASTIVIIDFKGNEHDERSSTPVDNTAARLFLTDNLLNRPTGFLYAFDIAPLSLALFQTLDLRIANAIDMQCAGAPRTRAPLATVKQAVGDLHHIYDDNIKKIFSPDTITECHHGNPLTKFIKFIAPLALRAWIAHYLSQLASMEDRLAQVPPVNTFRLSDNTLEFLAKSSKDSFQLDQKKPMEVTRRFTTSFDQKSGRIRAKADRYANKIRASRNQYASIAIGETGTGFALSGAVAKSEGRIAQLATTDDLNLAGKIISSITIIGRDDPTQAEGQRAQKVLEMLQGLIDLEHENPWVQLIFFASPRSNLEWPSAWTEEAEAAPCIRFHPDRASRPLNLSQTRAVKQMLGHSNDGRLTVIQGPPGTGKTTVIASFVQAAVAGGLSGIWLIAQSNVAVKNIAEKLADFGLTQWKLLVSREFFEDWHEHLYTNIRANTIISEDFTTPGLLQKHLQGCPVVLCTLSMISSFTLRKFGGFTTVPIKTLIIDEASQIEIGDYIPLFTSHSTIRKVCFIGDDKQLPPHGQEDIQELKSIFEVKHLKDHAIFLNIQYRMPPQIGWFISQAIYDSQLDSNPEHPITTERMACHFINIPSQEQPHGTSWKNLGECQTILKIATMLQEKNKDFRIITPYDAQRSLIEEGLKANQLDWEDKCFNVDSFQGNEEDYIVISLVRSTALGFLADKRRTNVMLTRCKRGMIICTSQKFMERAGTKSLVGNLLGYYENYWVEREELERIVL